MHDQNLGTRPHEVCQGLGGKEEVKAYLSHPFLLPFPFRNYPGLSVVPSAQEYLQLLISP